MAAGEGSGPSSAGASGKDARGHVAAAQVSSERGRGRGPTASARAWRAARRVAPSAFKGKRE